ncbi:hypothetical protein ACG7TL_005101 [Trametes sanguinea]
MGAAWTLLSIVLRQMFREAREILSIVPGVGGLWSEPFLFGDDRYHYPSAMCIRKQVNEFRDLWLACHTHQEQTQLREKFAAEYLRREQFISAIEHFAHCEEERRRKELTEIRKVRVHTIIDRLRVGGWEQELDSMTESRMRQLCKLDIVYRTVPLTESAWNDMQKPLTEFMELTRAHRLWLAAVRLRLRWLQDIAKEYTFSVGRRKGPGGSAGSDLRVHFSDIATLHEVRTLLEAPVAVKQDSIAKLCDDMLATLPETWIQQQQPLFDDLVKQTPRASTLSDGALATLAIVCGEPGNVKTAWELLARYCGPCAARDLLTYTDIWKFIEYNIGYTQQFFFRANHDYDSRYSSVQFTEFQHSWRACTTKEEQQQLLKGQIVKYKQRIGIVRTLQSWSVEEEQQRRIVLERVRTERIEDVLKRLRDEGWGAELDKLTANRMKGLRALQIVDKAVPLTENAWQGMRKAVTVHMEFLRACRLEDEWFYAVSKRLQWLKDIVVAHNLASRGHWGGSDLLAEFSDIALFPELRTLLDGPTNTVVTQESLAKACEGALPALQDVWMRQHEPSFIQLVKQKPRMSSLPDSSILSLAIVTFKCKRCLNENMRWPYVLTHACGHRRLPHNSRTKLTYRDIVDCFCERRGLRRPHRRKYEFEVQLASTAVEEIIRVCGYDPLMATYAELRDSKVRIYCTICAVPSVGYAEAFDWQNAVHHSVPRCDTHGFGWGPLQIAKSTKWAVLGPEDTAMVLALENARRMEGSGLSDGLYRCTLCSHEASRFMWSHFRSAHKGKTPEIGKNFYIHPSSGNGKHYAIWVYPEYDRDDPSAVKDVENGSAIFSPRLFQ